MKLLFISLQIFTLVFCSSKHLKHFDGYRVLRAYSGDEDQYKALTALYDESDLDFWSPPMRNGTSDIMASTIQIPDLEEYLTEKKIKFEMMIEDVENLISEERNHRLSFKETGMNWKSYQNYETIMNWMVEIEQENPNLCKLITIGKSYEGNDLKVMKISKGDSPNKKAFFIDATLHAREWITPATATFIIKELIRSPEVGSVLDTVDFYILPVANPDGYIYSWETHRLWRKTRSFRDSYLGCRGVDLNRNFGFHFGERGSSALTCSEIYRGPTPFSEPESEAIRSMLMDYKMDNGQRPNWRGYLSLHSYGQFLFAPWGYTSEYPDDYADLMRVADESIEALTDVHGTWYTRGTAYNILYAASGNSVDWSKKVADIKYSYTMELRGTFLFSFGFLLPARYIEPTAEETWEAVQVIANAL